MIEKAKKIKKILEYTYPFGKRVNRVISINFDAYKNQRNSICIFISISNSISTIKNKAKNLEKDLL